MELVTLFYWDQIFFFFIINILETSNQLIGRMNSELNPTGLIESHKKKECILIQNIYTMVSTFMFFKSSIDEF